GEDQQGRQCVELEEGQRGVAARAFYPLECRYELGIGDLLPVDADTLVVADEVRGREHAGGNTARTQERLDMGDRRALAVGAADGDDRTRRLIYVQSARD